MPKGKVKSFLVVNDIVEMAVKSLLGKGWKNLLQTRKMSVSPSLPIRAGAGPQRAPAMALMAQAGAELEGDAEAEGPFHPPSLRAGAGGSGHVTAQSGWGQAPR